MAKSVVDKASQALSNRGRKYDHIELLEQIDHCGSISAAAKKMGMSYKTAWDAIEAMNNLAATPLLERRVGGANGGGAALTDSGRRLISAYRKLDKQRDQVLQQVSEVGHDFDAYFKIIRRFDMKTSARNQFVGTIKNIKTAEIEAEVIIDIGGGDEIIAAITRESADYLNLHPGMDVLAMIKSSWVILSADHSMRTSSRNRLTGKVSRCQQGSINSEVIVELAGGKTLAAIVTNDSVAALDIKNGTRITALIKASHVILAVDN